MMQSTFSVIKVEAKLRGDGRGLEPEFKEQLESLNETGPMINNFPRIHGVVDSILNVIVRL